MKIPAPANVKCNPVIHTEVLDTDALIKWFSLKNEDAPKPSPKTPLMVTGRDTKGNKFLCLAYYDEEFRPSLDGQIRWLDDTDTALSDYGLYPEWWAKPIWLPDFG